jgi:hypothetical protein
MVNKSSLGIFIFLKFDYKSGYKIWGIDEASFQESKIQATVLRAEQKDTYGNSL